MLQKYMYSLMVMVYVGLVLLLAPVLFSAADWLLVAAGFALIAVSPVVLFHLIKKGFINEK